MFPMIIGVLVVIGIIVFIVTAAKKKSNGEDLGEHNVNQ
jgi:hypothetical protein